MTLTKKAIAELIGTFWLVFGGCGTALIACGLPGVGVGYVGVALAFGLTVLTMAVAIGHISGCHLNPAVTLGLCAAGRFEDGAKGAAVYIVAQLLGGILAAALLFIIVNPDVTNAVAGTFATNGWSSDGTPRFGGQAYGMMPALVIECVLTFIFLLVIIGSTDRRAPAGLAPVSIGLCLTLIHLISIPVTNTSVNPARSIAMAAFVGGETINMALAISGVTIVGGVIAGLLYRYVFEEKKEGCCGGCCGHCKCKNAESKDEAKEADSKDEAKEAESKDEAKKED